MAWETRGGRQFFYTSRRIGDRVVKRYFGNGDLGEVAAGLVAGARRERAERAKALNLEKQALAPADAAMAALGRACVLMVEAELVAAGYHKVIYAWRRRRVRRDQDGGGDVRRG